MAMLFNNKYDSLPQKVDRNAQRISELEKGMVTNDGAANWISTQIFTTPSSSYNLAYLGVGGVASAIGDGVFFINSQVDAIIATISGGQFTVSNVSLRQGTTGAQGANGFTFIPAVDNDGNLSWTNNGGLSNPPTVNIKGEDGQDAISDTTILAPVNYVSSYLYSNNTVSYPVGSLTPSVSDGTTIPDGTLVYFYSGSGVGVNANPPFIGIVFASLNTTATFAILSAVSLKGANGTNGTNGNNGNDGAYFTPSVDLNGNLSWSNNGGLQNPATVNIKGEPGQNATSDGSIYNNIIAGADFAPASNDGFEIRLVVPNTDIITYPIKRFNIKGMWAYKIPSQNITQYFWIQLFANDASQSGFSTPMFGLITVWTDNGSAPFMNAVSVSNTSATILNTGSAYNYYINVLTGSLISQNGGSLAGQLLLTAYS